MAESSISTAFSVALLAVWERIGICPDMCFFADNDVKNDVNREVKHHIRRVLSV